MLRFRDFSPNDYFKVCEMLEHISHVPDSAKEACDIGADTHRRVVGLISERVVCYGQLTYSYRVRGGISAYIEDIVVAPDHRSNGVGSSLIQYLLGLAQKSNAYKVTLTCRPELYPFYKRAGFRDKGIHLDILF